MAHRESFYSTFYGLSSSPFHVTPDPGNLFLTDAHKHAIGAIHYGIVARRGFVVVTGEVGVGKTSVLRAALRRLPFQSTRLVYVLDPRLPPAQLNAFILSTLGGVLGDSGDLLSALQHRLLEIYKAGFNVVLAIDEAQNVPEETLEDLRVLSNFETRTEKLLQIILVGQPEFDVTLDKFSLRQLRQRVAVRATISSLTLRQSFAYVQHRLAASGRPPTEPLFSTAALLYIALVARGNPRTINIFCDNALMNSLGHKAERVSFSIAREALRQFSKHKNTHLRRSLLVGATVACIMATLAIGSIRFSARPALLQNVQVADLGQRVTPTKYPSGLPTSVEPPRVESVEASGAASASYPEESEALLPPESAASIYASRPQVFRSNPEKDQNNSLVARPPIAGPASQAKRETPEVTRSVKLFARSGDSLTELCRRVYGTCDKAQMHTVLHANPGLRPSRFITRSQMVIFPLRERERKTDQ